MALKEFAKVVLSKRFKEISKGTVNPLKSMDEHDKEDPSSSG